MQAVNEYVVISPNQTDDIKSSSTGLLIVDKQKYEEVKSGKIVSMGEKCKFDNISVGMEVLYFDEDIKSKFKLNGKELVNINYLNILAVQEN